MTGKEVMRAMIDGTFPQPSMAITMSFKLADFGEGDAAFEGTPGPHLLNPLGIVHGAWAFALIDSTTAMAAFTLLPAHTGFTSLETKVNFCKAITLSTGLVRCEGKVLHAGRRIMSTEAFVKDIKGNLLAHGTSTVMVLESDPAKPT